MTEQMLMDLLKIYESVREEYIELLKKGFLVFFPYLLGTRWREHYNNRYSKRNLVIYNFDLVKGSYFKEVRLFFVTANMFCKAKKTVTFIKGNI